ncbi:uncharacterized protein DS421_9g270970 [Arachis hypogaea]|nr:uncharacterized protein DS421_9g270970 [Arachis hypogaea]
MSDWLDSLVLLCVSVVDAEFCTEMRKRHRICGNSAREEYYELVAPDSDERVCFPTSIERERPFFYAYEYFCSQLNVTFPFPAFETDLLWSCNIAPSQLHPNSWGHKVFAMYDESFKDFKNYFFRVRAVEGAHPFFLDENDEPSFPLEWQRDGAPPHLDTKRFLNDPSLVQTVLEMSKNNDSMKAFKKAKKATAALNISAKVAEEGYSQVPVKPPVPNFPGPRKAIPTPRFRQVDPPQTSAVASGAPPLKKQKTSEPFNLDAPDFDAIEFVDQQIAPYGGLSMDDVSLLQHLNFITESSVKMAHMGAAIFRTVQGILIHATKSFMKEAKSEFDRIKGLKDELEVKLAKVEKELEDEKASSITLAASLKLAEDMALKHKDSYVSAYRELMHLRDDLKTARVNYAELQGHLVGSVTAASENLMEQFQIVAPDADLTLVSLDNVVKDGKIVPDDPDDDVEPPPVPSIKVSTSSVPLVMSDPDCQILNRDDGTIDAVPIQTRPPSPRTDATGKAPDLC